MYNLQELSGIKRGSLVTFLECGGGWERNEVVPYPLGRANLTHAKIWVSICASTESVSGELS